MNKKIKILVVEDNPGDVRLIEEMLKSAGARMKAEITKADTLNRGLISLSETEFEVIILDLGLPDSQGLNTFESIHSHAAKTPIIVLTGLADEELGMIAVNEGAEDYLVKGEIDGRLLSRSVSYSIERFRLKQELKAKFDEIERINRILTIGRDMEVQKLRKEIEKLKKKIASGKIPSA